MCSQRLSRGAADQPSPGTYFQAGAGFAVSAGDDSPWKLGWCGAGGDAKTPGGSSSSRRCGRRRSSPGATAAAGIVGGARSREHSPECQRLLDEVDAILGLGEETAPLGWAQVAWRILVFFAEGRFTPFVSSAFEKSRPSFESMFRHKTRADLASVSAQFHGRFAGWVLSYHLSSRLPSLPLSQVLYPHPPLNQCRFASLGSLAQPQRWPATPLPATPPPPPRLHPRNIPPPPQAPLPPPTPSRGTPTPPSPPACTLHLLEGVCSSSRVVCDALCHRGLHARHREQQEDAGSQGGVAGARICVGRARVEGGRKGLWCRRGVRWRRRGTRRGM